MYKVIKTEAYMDNGEKKLSSLFDGRTIFNIPEYQRAYAWGSSQLQDFVEDIENQKIDRSYFLGTVLFEEKGQEKNYKLIDIVDGQQRITTIIIFMTVLIELLRNLTNDEDELDDIDLLFETYVKYKSQFKLRALDEDNDFFHSYILSNNCGKDYIRTPAQRRLYKAKTFFSKYLSDFSKEELLIIKNKVDENSRVLVYSVQDTAEATLIFETTNDRGKGLTNLEKIKSFLMYKSYISSEETPEDLLNSIRSRFSDIYKEYEKYESKIAEDSILQYHFIAHQKWNAKEYQQYVSKVKSKINKFIVNKKNDKALHFIDKYSVELKESFLTVHDILKSKIPELRDIFILSRTGNFWPLLIKTYKLDKTENKSNFINIVKLLEKYSFRVYAVNQNRGNTGQSKLYSFARDFDGDYQELENKLKAIIRSYSSNKMFVSNMSDEWIYDWMTTRDLSYFFWKYENYLRTTKQPKSSPMSEEEFITKDSKFKLSIEHIASQTPNKSIVKDSSILPEVDEEFEEEFLHCLGNLTIDPQSSNSSKGNKIFEDKNEKYFIRAPFKTQNELDSFVVNNEWSRESISHRKQKLIDFALINWNID
ncbi:DUF262 domain-containing protein [Vibrio parahaemolyticus]|nr:DUF262 domain-containing protein [Vibrio parahaemolyticus]